MRVDGGAGLVGHGRWTGRVQRRGSTGRATGSFATQYRAFRVLQGSRKEPLRREPQGCPGHPEWPHPGWRKQANSFLCHVHCRRKPQPSNRHQQLNHQPGPLENYAPLGLFRPILLYHCLSCFSPTACGLHTGPCTSPAAQHATMARPSRSPSTRGNPRSSPERPPFMPDFLSENRNSELNHKDALAAAQLQHDRVREAAIRVYELHELQEAHQRVLLAKQKEEERLRIEHQIVAEEHRLRNLQAQHAPKLPPAPAAPKVVPTATPVQPKQPTQPTQPPRKASVNVPQPAAPSSKPEAPTPPSTGQTVPPQSRHNPFTQPAPTPPPSQAKPAALNGQVPASNPFAPTQQQQPPVQPKQQIANPFASQMQKQAAPVQQTPQSQPVAPKPTAASSPDRYLQIHQALKTLRKDVMAQGKFAPLKGPLGDMRREIRKSIGQLTDVKGANAKPVSLLVLHLCQPKD